MYDLVGSCPPFAAYVPGLNPAGSRSLKFAERVLKFYSCICLAN